MTKEVYSDAVLKKVIPAIMEKWPVGGKKNTIFIQQDNARPHAGMNNAAVEEEGRKHGWKRAIRNQPDVNVLDLGFLNSIQAIQHKKAPRTIDELVKGCSALLSNGGSIFRE